MTETLASLEKPFWLRHPWSILFDLEKLWKKDAWSIDIAVLLKSLLEELQKQPYVNFAVPGVAILSSAVIHRMKSELVLRLEEPQKPPAEKLHLEGPIPVIPIPIRYEHGTLTIEELLSAIRGILALKAGGTLESEASPSPLELTQVPLSLPSLDPYLVQIEEATNSLYDRLRGMLRNVAIVPFSKVVEDLSRRETILTFIALLFLACQSKLLLSQEDEPGDIYISLPLGNAL